MGGIFEIACFVLYFDTQFSIPFNTDLLFVMFVTINFKGATMKISTKNLTTSIKEQYNE